MPTVIVEPTAVTVTVTSSTTPAPPATTTTVGTVQLAGDLGGTATAPTVAKIQGTTVQPPPGVNTRFLAGDGSWQTAAAGSGVQLGGDIGGTNTVPQIISTHLSAALPIAQGGTAATTQQGAINSLTGTQSAGHYLRSDGTNATLSAIQASDVPTLNQNTTGTASNITGVAAVANGGTGASTAIVARANLGEYTWDTPAARGMIEYAFPPQMATISNNLVSGSIYGVSIVAQTSSSTSRVGVGVLSSAGTPTAGQNLIGLYSISGTTATQITVTGDLTTWSSQGFQSYLWGTPQTLVAGNTYLLLLMSNATTPVHLAGLSTTAGFPAMYNAGLSNTAAPWFKFFLNATAQTALPASFTISGTTMTNTSAQSPWVCML